MIRCVKHDLVVIELAVALQRRERGTSRLFIALQVGRRSRSWRRPRASYTGAEWDPASAIS